MRIAVDAAGGDHAPAAAVQGAVMAARDLGVRIALVGDERLVGAELARHDAPAGLVEIVHASEVIHMHDSPGAALRGKLDASMTVATALVAAGAAQAVFSAGNSGAFMGAALWKLGTIEGVSRPAIAVLVPSINGSTLILDAGANCDCRPRHLLQFALMGDVYARRALRLERPRVCLLNIGEEPTKGNELTKNAYLALSETDLNFVGNVEGTDLVGAKADVIVCDGFIGNIALKLGEGWATLFVTLLARELERLPPSVRGDPSLAAALGCLRRTVDYSEYGGALLLGVNGVVVFGHGRSSPKAIAAAIRVAKESVETRIVDGLATAFRERNMVAQIEPGTTDPEEPVTP